MATVFGRVYAYSVNKKYPMLNSEQMCSVGIIIKEEFFTNFKLKHIKKRQNENGKKVTVLDYHPDFTKKMDEMIADYYKQNGISPEKRTPIKIIKKQHLV